MKATAVSTTTTPYEVTATLFLPKSRELQLQSSKYGWDLYEHCMYANFLCQLIHRDIEFATSPSEAIVQYVARLGYPSVQEMLDGFRRAEGTFCHILARETNRRSRNFREFSKKIIDHPLCQTVHERHVASGN